jgi:hypothetical protein
MKKIKTYNSFINEGVKDLMKPKSNEEILAELDKLSPYKALMKVNQYDMKEIKAEVLKRVEEVNKQLYMDIKRFNRNNINEIMKFMNDWIEDNGGDYHILRCFNNILENLSFDYDDDMNEKYKINNKFRLYEDDDEEYEEEEDYEDDSVYHISNKISDKTIENFKQLLVSYTIDVLSNSKSEEEEFEEEE